MLQQTGKNLIRFSQVATFTTDRCRPVVVGVESRERRARETAHVVAPI